MFNQNPVIIKRRSILENSNLYESSDFQEQNCETLIIHTDVVEKVKADFPAALLIEKMAAFYKIFGDPTRVRILCALDKAELCVCDLSALLEMNVSAVSHQLKLLRESDLVKTRRQGKIVYYSLSDEHVQKIIECGMEHILEK